MQKQLQQEQKKEDSLHLMSPVQRIVWLMKHSYHLTIEFEGPGPSGAEAPGSLGPSAGPALGGCEYQ